MELNKTSGDTSLYSCNKDSRITKNNKPEPVDNREVKTFSLNQESRSNSRQQGKVARGDRRNQDEKKLEEGPASIAAKEEKKEGKEGLLYEGGGAGITMMDIIAPQSVEASLETSSVVVSASSLDWVETCIVKAVDSMFIGDIQGGQLVEVVLSENSEVPEAFMGANLTMTKDGEGISVAFSNFADQTQATKAMELVLGNPENLQSLVQNLGQRQLVLREMVVAGQVVQLPTREEVQSPLHMIAASIQHRDSEKDQDGQNDRNRRDQQKDEQIIQEVQL
ncbi:DUF5421 family protein [Chlamydiifrater phoenicopteri]|uniref:DUF5421 family protein n=1 Tax=Chlamydiifrater phoenicopteri TaxID=2681469 RepID=UPI001BCD3D9D|nr:DUF5421 family protein [Chlamydiifrater phoenicopteri]